MIYDSHTSEDQENKAGEKTTFLQLYQARCYYNSEYF